MAAVRWRQSSGDQSGRVYVDDETPISDTPITIMIPYAELTLSDARELIDGLELAIKNARNWAALEGVVT